MTKVTFRAKRRRLASGLLYDNLTMIIMTAGQLTNNDLGDESSARPL
jgi:hypothetical protein